MYTLKEGANDAATVTPLLLSFGLTCYTLEWLASLTYAILFSISMNIISQVLSHGEPESRNNSTYFPLLSNGLWGISRNWNRVRICRFPPFYVSCFGYCIAPQNKEPLLDSLTIWHEPWYSSVSSPPRHCKQPTSFHPWKIAINHLSGTI